MLADTKLTQTIPTSSTPSPPAQRSLSPGLPTKPHCHILAHTSCSRPISRSCGTFTKPSHQFYFIFFSSLPASLPRASSRLVSSHLVFLSFPRSDFLLQSVLQLWPSLILWAQREAPFPQLRATIVLPQDDHEQRHNVKPLPACLLGPRQQLLFHARPH